MSSLAVERIQPMSPLLAGDTVRRPVVSIVEPGFSHSRYDALGPARSIIDEYWVVQAARCRTAVETSLPDASVEVYFNLGPAGRHLVCERSLSSPIANRLPHRSAWVVGPHARTLLIAKETKDCDIVGVRLRPGVAASILGVPVSELGDGLVDLDALWGREPAETIDRLASTSSHDGRVAIVERALMRRFTRQGRTADTGRVRSLCAAVLTMPNPSVREVAHAHGMSHRRVIALFDHHVGLKPKAFHRVQRLRGVFESIGAKPRASWAQIAVRNGYCDQAHMIHDFRKLTGLTPGEYEHRRSSVGHGSIPFRVAGPA